MKKLVLCFVLATGGEFVKAQDGQSAFPFSYGDDSLGYEIDEMDNEIQPADEDILGDDFDNLEEDDNYEDDEDIGVDDEDEDNTNQEADDGDENDAPYEADEGDDFESYSPDRSYRRAANDTSPDLQAVPLPRSILNRAAPRASDRVMGLIANLSGSLRGAVPLAASRSAKAAANAGYRQGLKNSTKMLVEALGEGGTCKQCPEVLNNDAELMDLIDALFGQIQEIAAEKESQNQAVLAALLDLVRDFQSLAARPQPQPPSQPRPESRPPTIPVPKPVQPPTPDEQDLAAVLEQLEGLQDRVDALVAELEEACDPAGDEEYDDDGDDYEEEDEDCDEDDGRDVYGEGEEEDEEDEDLPGYECEDEDEDEDGRAFEPRPSSKPWAEKEPWEGKEPWTEKESKPWGGGGGGAGGGSGGMGFTFLPGFMFPQPSFPSQRPTLAGLFRAPAIRLNVTLDGDAELKPGTLISHLLSPIASLISIRP